jgi:hypothetical protein
MLVKRDGKTFARRGEQLIEVEVTESSGQPLKIKGARKAKPPPFIKVPGVWVGALLKVRSGATHRLALHLLNQHFRAWAKNEPLCVSTEGVGLAGIRGRKQKQRALAELEALGLVAVLLRGSNRAPLVRLLGLDEV